MKTIPKVIDYVTPSEEAICLHETGHACAALVVGLAPTLMELVSDPESSGLARNSVPRGDQRQRRIIACAAFAVEYSLYSAGRLADAAGATEEGDPILVVGRVGVRAKVSYSHPNWDEAMYDSEDKVLIPFEDVSGETEIELSIDVSMTIAVDDKGAPTDIEELSFRNRDFQCVTLYPTETYK